MSGFYSFEVLIGMHSADRSTDNNQSAQRRKKKQKHQQWQPNRMQFVNPSGKTGTQIPQLPLGDNSPPWGDNAVCT
jgi:hypothetical protein